MPSRDEIKPRVMEAIAKVAQKAPQEIQETDRLWEDLDMGELLRKAMAKPYTEISKSYSGGLAVGMDEAGALETVRASIDLVNRRANGDPQ